MELLELGKTVTIKVKNILWPHRHLYAAGVVSSEFNYYTGTIMREKWFAVDEVGITTGNPDFPFRRINRERIVAVGDKAVNFTQVPADREVRTFTGSKGDTYTVTREGRRATCTCTGFQFRKKCKHIDEVLK